MSILKRIALTLTAGAAALCLIAPAAHAEAVMFTDGAKGGGPDIKWAEVSYGAGYAQLLGEVGRLNGGDKYTVWFDTNAKDGGPEYKLEVAWASDYYGLWSVETFKSSGKLVNTERCAEGFVAEQPTRSSIYLAIPRKCIGSPSRIRITFRADFYGSAPTDYLPAKDNFTGWVTYN